MLIRRDSVLRSSLQTSSKTPDSLVPNEREFLCAMDLYQVLEVFCQPQYHLLILIYLQVL